ncbi:hypothetical protein J6590_012931 [Homalodisca vitripennis]|nr:hypothetical protein J6590_012931 [Homalodisca vitripennis]
MLPKQFSCRLHRLCGCEGQLTSVLTNQLPALTDCTVHFDSVLVRLRHHSLAIYATKTILVPLTPVGGCEGQLTSVLTNQLPALTDCTVHFDSVLVRLRHHSLAIYATKTILVPLIPVGGCEDNFEAQERFVNGGVMCDHYRDTSRARRPCFRPKSFYISEEISPPVLKRFYTYGTTVEVGSSYGVPVEA